MKIVLMRCLVYLFCYNKPWYFTRVGI